MPLTINPGSHVGTNSGNGWTNTFQTAKDTAEKWLDRMHLDGFTDVALVKCDEFERESRWTFTFKHAITGVEVELETHGIDDWRAYDREHLFTPATYWNGSNSAEPELEHFAAEGFTPLRTYLPAGETVHVFDHWGVRYTMDDGSSKNVIEQDTEDDAREFTASMHLPDAELVHYTAIRTPWRPIS